MAAFKPCAPCAYVYRRVYAWGGNYANNDLGLYYGGAKSDFVSCYLSAVNLVNSIDITTVPWGQIRYFDYGGYTASKDNCDYTDYGNIPNTPDALPNGVPGDGLGVAPSGTADYGAISIGGSELSYMGLTNGINGVNAGGYKQAIWGGSGGFQPHGVFGISRIQVLLGAAKCNTKWSLVYWDNNGYPAPGSYTIQCQCDATTRSSCPSCENGSAGSSALCVDIPPITWFTQLDPDLPCSQMYFVPGFNCADLT